MKKILLMVTSVFLLVSCINDKLFSNENKTNTKYSLDTFSIDSLDLSVLLPEEPVEVKGATLQSGDIQIFQYNVSDFVDTCLETDDVCTLTEVVVGELPGEYLYIERDGRQFGIVKMFRQAHNTLLASKGIGSGYKLGAYFVLEFNNSLSIKDRLLVIESMRFPRQQKYWEEYYSNKLCWPFGEYNENRPKIEYTYEYTNRFPTATIPYIGYTKAVIKYKILEVNDSLISLEKTYQENETTSVETLTCKGVYPNIICEELEDIHCIQFPRCNSGGVAIQKNGILSYDLGYSSAQSSGVTTEITTDYRGLILKALYSTVSDLKTCELIE